MTLFSWLFAAVDSDSQVVPWDVWDDDGFTLCNWTKIGDCKGGIPPLSKKLDMPQHCFHFLPSHRESTNSSTERNLGPYSYGRWTGVTDTSVAFKCTTDGFTFFLADQEWTLYSLLDNFLNGECVEFVDKNGIKGNYGPVGFEWINETLRSMASENETVRSKASQTYRPRPTAFDPCPEKETASRGHHETLSMSLSMLMLMFQARK